MKLFVEHLHFQMKSIKKALLLKCKQLNVLCVHCRQYEVSCNIDRKCMKRDTSARDFFKAEPGIKFFANILGKEAFLFLLLFYFRC